MSKRSTAKSLLLANGPTMTARHPIEQPPERPISHLLHRAMQVMDQLLLQCESLRDAGITPRQYVVLCAIARNEGSSQASLTNATSIDRSTLSDIIRRLTEKGWTVRRKSRIDKRSFTVFLSARGALVLNSAHDMVASSDEKLLSMLPGHLQEPFIASLNRLAAAAPQVGGDQLPSAGRS